MSELRDLFEMENGDFTPEDYIWISEIAIPNHPLGKIELRGISPEHIAEKFRDCLGNGWNKYFSDFNSELKAQVEIRNNCRLI
jgi:hypothetical protein